MNMVAEGVKTARSRHRAGRAVRRRAADRREVDAVVNEGRTPADAFRGLRRITPTSEIDGLA